jgi:hypothetical protein
MGQGELLYLGTADGLLIYSASGLRVLPVGRALGGRAVSAILALDASTLLVAAEDLPPQQSFDGGASWSDAPGAAIEPVGLRAATAHGPVALAHPRLMGATAYARLEGRPPVLVGAGAGGALLFRSLDDGIHWQPAAMPAGDLGRVSALAPGPAATWAATDTGLLLSSDDHGASWREVARLGVGITCLYVVADIQ